MKRKITSIVLGAVAAVFGYSLFKYSLYLAAMRIYQVDECQNVFVARILAAGQAEHYYTGITLFLAPLVWLARDATQSVELFASARLVSLVIFWFNLILLTLATGERLLTRRGLFALIGAGTLAPLWDYGFEIRHDNLLLTGLLLTWCVMRVHPAGILSYAMTGALAVAMQFIAFKAFVYTVPLTVAILLFPPLGERVPRLRLALAWAAGGLGMLVAIRLAYGAAGIWETYMAGFRWVSGVSTDGNRFLPWDTLGRLLFQTPLLLALLLAGLLAVLIDVRRRGRAALTWEGPLPEAAFLLVAFAALIANPAPYPYNLVNLVPFAFLFAFRYAATVSKELWAKSALRPVMVTVLIFAHLVPFVIATHRHLDWTNFRQESVMQLAENLTDPKLDAVYDGIGLVPTRRSVGYHWFLHSLNIQGFRDKSGLAVRDMLTTNPAPVIITSYRTDWLPEADHDFIRSNYVAVSDDFWVLGTVLPPGGGEFRIIHGGRYRISTMAGSDLAGSYPAGFAGKLVPEDPGTLTATLDGIPFANRPVDLAPGIHRLGTATNCEAAVVWLGPRRERLHRQSGENHLRLFCNWY